MILLIENNNKITIEFFLSKKIELMISNNVLYLKQNTLSEDACNILYLNIKNYYYSNILTKRYQTKKNSKETK